MDKKPIDKNEDVKFSMEKADGEDIEAIQRAKAANKRVEQNPNKSQPVK